MTVVWVALDAPLRERCRTFGKQMIAGYASGRMSTRQRLPGNSDDMQSHAKMAECAVAHFIGADPIEAVDWFGERKNGEGYDLVCGEYRIEVRHTKRGRSLIWPLPRIGSFHRKEFNMLALVIGEEPLFEVAGIVSKDRFFLEKLEAGDHSKMEKGTWFMDRSNLDDVYPLLLKIKPLSTPATPA